MRSSARAERGSVRGSGRFRRFAGIAVVLVVLAVILAACSGGDSSSNSDKQSSSTTGGSSASSTTGSGGAATNAATTPEGAVAAVGAYVEGQGEQRILLLRQDRRHPSEHKEPGRLGVAVPLQHQGQVGAQQRVRAAEGELHEDAVDVRALPRREERAQGGHHLGQVLERIGGEQDVLELT